MTTSTTKLLTGVAVAALAAAGVAAVVSYRRGERPSVEQHAQLEELETRLNGADAADGATRGRIGHILDTLQRTQGISVERMRNWITGIRQGTLSPEQTTVAESDFDTLERHADQSGI